MKVQSRFVRGRQIFVLFYLGVQSTMRDDTQKYVQFTCNIITCTMKSHYGMGLAFITWRKIIFALFAINKSTFTISAKYTCTNKLNTITNNLGPIIKMAAPYSDQYVHPSVRPSVCLSFHLYYIITSNHWKKTLKNLNYE
jgi:hypothetical protein